MDQIGLKVNNLNTARTVIGGSGIQTAALAAGGGTRSSRIYWSDRII